MVKEICNNKEAKLKLIHLLWIILVFIASAFLTAGRLIERQKVNSDTVVTLQAQKVEKEVFVQHQKEQERQFTEQQITIKDGFKEVKEQIKNIQK